MSAVIHDLAAERKARERIIVERARELMAQADARILGELREALARLKAADAAVSARLK